MWSPSETRSRGRTPTVSDQGVWVSTFYSGTVALIDPSTRTIAKKLTLPGQASGLLFAGGALWASVYSGGEVVKIDPQAAKVVRSVTVGVRPRDLVSDGDHIWVVNEVSNSVSRIAP